jgi:hypothetical protein
MESGNLPISISVLGAGEWGGDGASAQRGTPYRAQSSDRVAEDKQMFERLDLLSRHPIDKALDILYEEFDKALLAGEFEAVDIYMRHAIVSHYRVETLVGFLTISLQWKDHLKERAGFYARVKSLVEKSYPDRAEKILMGLE